MYDMASKAFTPSNVLNDPLIYTGSTMKGVSTWAYGHQQGNFKETQNTGLFMDNLEKKWLLLIKYLWQKGTESIHSKNEVNTDASSYFQRLPKKCLQVEEKEKKGSFWRHFSSNTVIYHLCFALWKSSWVRRPSKHHNGLLVTLRWSEMKPSNGCGYLSRLRFPSQCYGKITSVSKACGYPQYR